MKDVILVTGASGLVGHPLIKKLLVEHKVIGLDLRKQTIKSPKYIHLRKTIKNVSDFLLIFKTYKVSRIVHAGGVSGPMLFNDEPHKIIENNVFLTMYLIEAIRQYKNIRRLIFCSSISAYGDINVSNTNESSKFSPTNVYGSTKASCDLILESYYKNYNLDIISLRFSTIYGYGRITSCFINDMIKSSSEKKRLNLPFKRDLQWPYIYVSDVVTSIYKCLFYKNSHRYSYNVGGPDFPSYRQILNLISLEFSKLNVTFSKRNKIGERKTFSTKKIKKDINWEPQFNIERGLKDYFKNLNIK